LHLGGQSDELARHGGRIMAIIGMGLPAYMVSITSVFFLEGIKRPKPAAVITIISNVLNIALNWVLVYGNLGMPALGAEGSAITTVIIRWTSCLIILGYILNMEAHHVFGVRVRPQGGWRAWAEQRRFGYSAAISIGVESISFSTVGMFAGWLGKSTLAAYSITHNLIALVFMVALGFGSSTTVRVGFFRGRGDRQSQQIAGWMGLTLNTLAMLALGIVFVLFSTVLASGYSSDPRVIAIAAPLIIFCAIVIIADGGQAIMVNALRGSGDKWAPPLIQGVSYLSIMVPLAWWLAIDRNGGVIGIFHAMLMGSASSFALLSIRFYRMR
jgi:MATE family multidrug resistance protein